MKKKCQSERLDEIKDLLFYSQQSLQEVLHDLLMAYGITNQEGYPEKEEELVEILQEVFFHIDEIRYQMPFLEEIFNEKGETPTKGD